MFATEAKRSWITDILLLIIVLSGVFSFLLGERPLNVPDESRYCEIPREMLASGDFVTPHLNGIKYFEKPALFYWMQAGALKTFGLNQWACRATNAFIALLGCLAVYIFSRLLFDRRTALFSTMILTTSFYYFTLAHVVTLDMTVAVMLTVTLLSFITAVQYPPGTIRRLLFYLMYIFAALAVLTKGLIGIIFPGSIIFLWMLFCHRWRDLKYCYLPSGILIFLLVALPWHILVQRANPEFFNFYFINQQFTRYLTKDAGRYQPFWFYIPIILLGIYPWTGFLYSALRRLKRNNITEMFLLIWTVFIFLFYSLSKSKLMPYILPTLPALAIILGRFFALLPTNSTQKTANKTFWFSFGLISVINIALVIAVSFYLTPKNTTNFVMATHWTRIIQIDLIFNAIITLLIFWRYGWLKAFATQACLTVIFLCCILGLLPYVYMHSVKPLAMDLKAVLQPNDMIANYDYYYQDLPFYLNRTVTIVNWGGELSFGQQHQDTKELMLDNDTFWPIWQSSRTVYMMLAKDMLPVVEQHYPNYHFYPFAEYMNDLIVVNHEKTP